MVFSAITCLYTFKSPGKTRLRTANPPEDDDPRLEWNFAAQIDWESDDDGYPTVLCLTIALVLVQTADFTLKCDEHGRIGTTHFMAPEIVLRRPYGKPADVWSCGVLLYVLLTGTQPFLGTKEWLYESICSGHVNMTGRPWDVISNHAKDILNKMLALNPKDRITVEEALNHAWIKERELCAPKMHLQETVDELAKFNARRKLKGAVIAAVSSPKWNNFYNDPNMERGADFDLEEVTSAVSMVLDSLDDIHCLTECPEHEREFLLSVLDDTNLHALLDVSTIPSHPFFPLQFAFKMNFYRILKTHIVENKP
ncbi:hypothetical protein CEXT_308761 [Caerostris extrusa]|uniref:Protein kinase domain-containing protein n=1 Tax=Caerostris extrusa TaxID=172846 RepID=A0AAV4WME9_CAEEX|nr:hypothetical protein CEXT_308761 [Caerostris extrusa]